jgi:hypothetical protein
MHFSRLLKSAFLAAATLASSLALLPAQNLNIDCGGYENYTASDGTVWLADRYFSGGQQLYTGYPVSGTPDPLLFRTARVGYYGGFSYAIPIANGQYNVTLRFADVQYWVAGQRVFNVSLGRLGFVDLVGEPPNVGSGGGPIYRYGDHRRGGNQHRRANRDGQFDGFESTCRCPPL